MRKFVHSFFVLNTLLCFANLRRKNPVHFKSLAPLTDGLHSMRV
uniref:Uncharacterized protein n=1 Tax=Anguilla anguilla TaxID=7936 RepID=A0A0E9QSV7_ANGAN